MVVGRPVEVELKYRVEDRDAAERLVLGETLGPFQAAGPAKAVDTDDRYVDTAAGAVASAGFAARLRSAKGGATIASVKSLGMTEGPLQRRTELEGPTDGSLTPTAWPDSPARSFLLEVCGDAPLEDLVTLRQRRRKRQFATDGATVEVSLDDVAVLSGASRLSRFTEIEIELVSGDETPLLELRAELDVAGGLRASTASKFETALAAVRQHGARARAIDETVAALTVGKTPGVTADDVVAEAGRKVLRFHLARMVAREHGTRVGEDPEDLHAMRVATRRMRAAWRVFGEGFRHRETARFQSRLRDVARDLGAVRDIDVLIDGLEAYRATIPPEERSGLAPLLADWLAQREAARSVLMRELDSGRYRRFVEGYVAFVLTPGAGSLAVSPTDPHHVRDTAASRIWHAYEAVLAYGPVLRWADVPTLHQLRIAGKWLRYTLEFVAEALGPDARTLIERVVALQDHLGLMNDAEVASIKARALLVARAGSLSDAETAAIARYLAAKERDVARLKRGAAGPWRAVASAAFRRGLGRATATLAAPGATATRL